MSHYPEVTNREAVVITLEDRDDFEHMNAVLGSDTALDPFTCLTCKRISDALAAALGAIQ